MKRLTTGLLLAAALALPLSLISAPSASAGARIGISVNFGPPALLWYPQPVLPGEGYFWVPGYWGWGSYGYFWVPGAWMWPPMIGFLWTPGYWGWNGGYYWWYPGYWGRRVGFYGGISYGYGYSGRGYDGGYWRHGHLHYNRAVLNVNTDKSRFTYRKPVVRPHRGRRISYNGGKGGIALRPTVEQQVRTHERHLGLTTAQTRHRERARRDPALRFVNNHGTPPVLLRHQMGRAGAYGHGRPEPMPRHPAPLRGHERPAGRPMPPVIAPHDRFRPMRPAERPHRYNRPAPPVREPVHRPPEPPRLGRHPPQHEAPVWNGSKSRPPVRHPPTRRPHRQRGDHKPPA